MIAVQIIYALFCVWFARYNARRIIADKRIYHGINGAIHLSVACACGYFFSIISGVIILLLARVVFDSALNYFRFGYVTYVSQKPKSLADRLAKKVFGNNKEVELLLEVFLLIILNTL